MSLSLAVVQLQLEYLQVGPTEIRYSIAWTILLANVNSRSRSLRSLYAVARPSVVCLSSVCLSSVTLVHPTQAVQIFDDISAAFGTLAIR